MLNPIKTLHLAKAGNRVILEEATPIRLSWQANCHRDYQDLTRYRCGSNYALLD